MENDVNNRDYAKIPRVVVKRLFKYHSALENLIIDGVSNVSSNQLSEDVHVKASQLRKDLAYCGEFGTRGKGYEVSYLHDKLSEILGLQIEWNYILAGLGLLGRALVNYGGFFRRGFKIKAIFDTNSEKIGKPYHDIMVHHIDELLPVVKDLDIKIGLITVPTDSAQSVCDKMIEAEISAILNFAPVLLKPTDNIFIERVDISREMVTLSHYLSHHEY